VQEQREKQQAGKVRDFTGPDVVPVRLGEMVVEEENRDGGHRERFRQRGSQSHVALLGEAGEGRAPMTSVVPGGNVVWSASPALTSAATQSRTPCGSSRFASKRSTFAEK